MKKILLAFDGKHFPANAFWFARMLNENQSVMLTGIFLPEPIPAGIWSYVYGTDFPDYTPSAEETELMEIKRNVDKFISLCDEHSIQNDVHSNFSSLVLPNLKRETRFADIMLLSETFYDYLQPNDKYLKVTIGMTECPVMVIPEKFEFSSNNILAYDGSASSVFAIKQFAYLFPELAFNETLLVTINEDGELDRFPDQHHITGLLAKHFPNLIMEKVGMDFRKYLFLWLEQKKNALFVTGSFDKPALSWIFKKSFIECLFEDMKLSLFIAHR